ncbi:hypothetical protein CRUP_032779 [Coryphaenoides rupestris]|nr:hypothetical protein CRUP_032779 [Coryphaenoides rupestris]
MECLLIAVIIRVSVQICRHCVSGFYSARDDVVELDPSNFNREVIQSDSLWLIEFYAPWCGHCQSLTADWKKAATALKGVVKVGAVDADQHKSLGSQYGVRGFPTIKVFGANKNKPEDYQGGRSDQAIVEGAMNTLRSLVKERLSGKSGGSDYSRQSGGGGGGGGSGSTEDMVVLTEENFEKLVLDGDSVCLEPEWAAAASAVQEQTKGKVRLGAVDATVHQGLSSRYGVRGFPTIKVFRKGEEPEDYQGGGPALTSSPRRWICSLTTLLLLSSWSEDTLKTCVNSQLCVIAVLPHILDTGASGRNSYLDVVRKMADKYKKKMWGWLWTEGGAQMELESALGIGGFGYPAMAAINARKMKYALLKGSFRICLWVVGLPRQSGDGAWPKIMPVEPWDGKDGELPAEEEYDFSDVDLDDVFDKTEL